MKKLLTSTVTALVGFLPMTTVPASAYQIDCAILLCLSGGWPASAPCSAAKAEFIRRITPWPVEPPLQIWRCPMSASFEGEAPIDPETRLFDIMTPAKPRQSFATDNLPVVQAVDRREGGSPMPEDIRLYLAQNIGTGADIDLSDPAFDFIRSIDVFQVQLNQRETRDSCSRNANILRGTYDATGQFSWRAASYRELPEAFVGDARYPSNCPDVRVRAVFVDWNDYEGAYGFEQVNY